MGRVPVQKMALRESSDSEEYLSAPEDETTQKITGKTKGLTSDLSDLTIKEKNSETSTGKHVAGVTDESRDTHDANRHESATNEFISDLDNRYVSENVDIKGGDVELTEEQIKVCHCRWSLYLTTPIIFLHFRK